LQLATQVQLERTLSKKGRKNWQRRYKGKAPYFKNVEKRLATQVKGKKTY
jgi:hypothetical protein